MPHAVSMPSRGLQALILCGPGVSLTTFTSNPDDFPKALVPIANRPMIWYPLDFCYRMGITTIHLLTPASSAPAIQTALSQNPHLTSLPLPKPVILAPQGLTQTTGTAEILRLPEVVSAITSDFLVLPCDLITTISPESLLETWLTYCQGHTKSGCRGGLAVYYPTASGEGHIADEETDFIQTAFIPPTTSAPPPACSLRPNLARLVSAMPSDTLNDVVEEKKTFPIRHALLRKTGRIRLLMTYRDAHIYFFPHWVLRFVAENPEFESMSEDVIGWWAKATWQDGLAAKLHLPDILSPSKVNSDSLEDLTADPDPTLLSLSTTLTSKLGQISDDQKAFSIPSILAYIHPTESACILHRVDTTPLLLSMSLVLSRLTPGSHPIAFTEKHLTQPPPHTTIPQTDVLLAPNVVLSPHVIIHNTVIGSNCKIGQSARLTRCLLMDGAEVGDRAVLTGCVLGRRCRVGRGARLTECEVQEGNMVPEETEAKGEKFMVFEGLDERVGSEGDLELAID